MDYLHKENMHDVRIEEGLNTTGMFPLLAWFLNDFIDLRRMFRILSVKRKRSNVRKVRKYKSAFTGKDMALGIIAVILSGLRSFEKIDERLQPERKLAEVLGLRRFLDKTYARKFLGEFSLFHVRQLERINTRILREFGGSLNQRISIVDLDFAVRPPKRTKAERVTKTRGPIKRTPHQYIWAICSSKEEIVSHKLGQGAVDSFQHFVSLIDDVRSKTALMRMIMRVNGEYIGGAHLAHLVQEGFHLISHVEWDIFLRCNEDLDVHDLPWTFFTDDESEDKNGKGIMHIKLCDVGEKVARTECPYGFRSVLVEIIRENMATRKRRRHRRYVIIHNIPGIENERACYEFYRHRQTIENIFKGGKNPFTHGKMPSGRFRANEAYLNFVIIAYNLFTLFKKNACPVHGREALLRLLEI